MLKEYADSGIVPFHMPGHKLGKGLPQEFVRELAALDITEIPGADNLHRPAGVIKQAQELAAKAFGSDRTFFLVNGSTCGIYAMISAICRPGDSLVVARDCHKSVINGMMLAGVRPIYIMPEYDSHFGISAGIPAERLKQILSANKDAAGVILTRPNYYGICSDIERIASIVHSYGKILAVDEAHGAHLRFWDGLPICAMGAGADICVQSAHKTLPAFTQGAYLHVKSGAVDVERLEYYLSVYQTSSPSYIIMASLDIARAQMQKEGGRRLEGLAASIEKNKAGLSGEAVSFIDEKTIAKYRTDPTRVVANVRHLGMTGCQAENVLRSEYNIQVEMSDLYNIVCIATIADDDGTIDRLFACLGGLCSRYAVGGERQLPAPLHNGFREPEQKLDYNDAMRAESEWIGLEQAAHRISKGMVSPYPPGIPVVCPGEVISPAAAGHIRGIVAAGGKVDGLNGNLEINVIK